MNRVLVLFLGGCAAGPTEPSTTDSAVVDTRPEWCPEIEKGRSTVRGTDASPYYVQHPLDEAPDAPVVLFLPGGNGRGLDTGHATATWNAFFDDDPRGFRIVMPFVQDDGYPFSLQPPVEAILDEVLACWGEPDVAVHLAGHSNGGMLAFDDVGPALADRLTSVTGAPGVFTFFDADDWSGVAFHHSVGELDLADWVEVVAQSAQLTEDAGLPSTHTVWPGEGHTPSPAWQGRDGMFAFWAEHSP